MTRQGDPSGPIAVRTLITIDGDVTVNVDTQFLSNELWQQHLDAIKRKTHWLQMVEKFYRYYIGPVAGISSLVFFLNEPIDHNFANFLAELWSLIKCIIIPTWIIHLVLTRGIRLFIKPTVGRLRKNIFTKVFSSFNRTGSG